MTLEECYRLFGITPDARLYEINQAYRDLTKVLQADRFSNDPGIQAKAQEQLKEFDIAYRMLLQFLSQRLAKREQEHEEREHAGQKTSKVERTAKTPEKKIKAHLKDRDRVQPEYKGVRGWLLFFCVSLTVFQPVYYVGTMALLIRGANNSLPELTSTLTIIFLSGISVYSIYTGVCLWMIRPNAVSLTKLYLIASLCLLFVFKIFIGKTFNIDSTYDNKWWIECVVGLVYTITWYWYLKKSKRVMSVYKPIYEATFKAPEYKYTVSSFIYRHLYMTKGWAFIVILSAIILIVSINHTKQEDHGPKTTDAPVEVVPPAAPDDLTQKEPAVSLNDAYGAYNKGDYSTAYKLFKALADQGEAEAQFLLGVMYAGGQGVPKDDAEAVKWYRKAADQGHAKSQYNMGLTYANGEGVPQDYAEAVKWLCKAGDQGDAEAQFLLGVMYADSEGVENNDAEAAKWYRKAADQGYVKAQYNLGIMYLNGEGVPQDYAEAVKWFRMAADKGIAQAQYNLGLMYYAGLGLPQDLVQAHKWYSLAAAQGDEDAQKSRDLIARMMTAAQIAEAQRLVKGSKPNKPQ